MKYTKILYNECKGSFYWQLCTCPNPFHASHQKPIREDLSVRCSAQELETAVSSLSKDTAEDGISLLQDSIKEISQIKHRKMREKRIVENRWSRSKIHVEKLPGKEEK